MAKEKKETKFLKRKTVVKKILRSSKIIVTAKPREPAPYVSRYFKEEVEEAKNALFFK